MRAQNGLIPSVYRALGRGAFFNSCALSKMRKNHSKIRQIGARLLYLKNNNLWVKSRMGEEVELEEGEKVVRKVDEVKLVSERLSARGSLLLTDRRLVFIYGGKVEFAGVSIQEAMVKKAYKTFAPFGFPLYDIIDVKKPFLKKELVLVVRQKGAEIGEPPWRADDLFQVKYRFTDIEQPAVLKSEIMEQVKIARARRS